MGSRKDALTKSQLASEKKTNKRVPLWVMMRTNRKVSQNPQRKHWRLNKKNQERKRKQKASRGKK
jgi:large subunit ribosomal protein L39e